MIVFGVPDDIKPIKDLPAGKARIRFRKERAAVLFVKTEFGISQFWLENCGEYWSPLIVLGRNVKLCQS